MHKTNLFQTTQSFFARYFKNKDSGNYTEIPLGLDTSQSKKREAPKLI